MNGGSRRLVSLIGLCSADCSDCLDSHRPDFGLLFRKTCPDVAINVVDCAAVAVAMNAKMRSAYESFLVFVTKPATIPTDQAQF